MTTQRLTKRQVTKEFRASEQTLYSRHPGMLTAHPIRFLIFLALFAVYGFGVLLMALWFFSCLSVKLTVTNRRIIFRRGILSRSTNEVLLSDVRHVRVEQSLGQRLFGVGTLAVASAAQVDGAIQFRDMPGADKARELIQAYRAAPITS